MLEEVNVWMTGGLIPPPLDTAPERGNELVQGYLKFVAKLRQRLKPLAPETSASSRFQWFSHCHRLYLYQLRAHELVNL